MGTDAYALGKDINTRGPAIFVEGVKGEGSSFGRIIGLLVSSPWLVIRSKERIWWLLKRYRVSLSIYQVSGVSAPFPKFNGHAISYHNSKVMVISYNGFKKNFSANACSCRNDNAKIGVHTTGFAIN